MSDRLVASLLFALAVAFASRSPALEPTCHEPLGRSPIAGESIGLVYGAEIGREVVEEAVAIWRSCPNYRGDFPALVHGPSTATVFVQLLPGTSGSKRCGHFRGRTITLYRWARVSDRSVRGCGSLALNLAHELGHVLGLADAREDPGCARTIMADLEPGNLFERTIAPEECRLAGERWSTLIELAHAEGPASDAPFGRRSVTSQPAPDIVTRRPER